MGVVVDQIANDLTQFMRDREAAVRQADASRRQTEEEAGLEGQVFSRETFVARGIAHRLDGLERTLREQLASLDQADLPIANVERFLRESLGQIFHQALLKTAGCEEGSRVAALLEEIFPVDRLAEYVIESYAAKGREGSEIETYHADLAAEQEKIHQFPHATRRNSAA